MVQHIVRLFLDDEFHIKLTKDVQIKAATETFKYLVHCLKLCIVTDTKPNDVVKRSAIEMSSLPWLTTIDPPWFDFKPAEYSESQLLTLYNRRKLCFTDKVLGKCLQLLSLLGGVSKCITWFSHVIRNALVSLYFIKNNFVKCFYKDVDIFRVQRAYIHALDLLSTYTHLSLYRSIHQK